MRLIRPTTLTDAMLTSSTAPETDYPAWSSVPAYALGLRPWRSVIWFVGFLATLTLLIAALF